MKRFLYASGGDLEKDELAIVSAWDELHAAWRDTNEEILSALRPVNEDIDKGKYSPNLFAIKAEEALAEKVPTAFTAVNGLRQAITFLDGRNIQWWHYQGPKPVRRLETETIEEIVNGNVLVEGGNAYERFGGRVLGSEVGFNNIFQTMGVWIEVEHTEPADLRIRHPFEAMYGIELAPQQQSR